MRTKFLFDDYVMVRLAPGSVMLKYVVLVTTHSALQPATCQILDQQATSAPVSFLFLPGQIESSAGS